MNPIVEELTKLGVTLNEEKTRQIDLVKGATFSEVLRRHRSEPLDKVLH